MLTEKTEKEEARREVAGKPRVRKKFLLKVRNGQHSNAPAESSELRTGKQVCISFDYQKPGSFCQSCFNGVEGLEARLQWDEERVGESKCRRLFSETRLSS